MSKVNSDGRKIRFINSRYEELFEIPDGNYIEICYPQKKILKPCKFIDEYHTKIGNEVFHICKFAELMESKGAVYMAESKMPNEKAAWRVGRDRILALQTCDEGYDYTLFDKDYQDVNGGQVDSLDITMLEVRKDILESYGLDNQELQVLEYDDIMEKSATEFQKAWNLLYKK